VRHGRRITDAAEIFANAFLLNEGLRHFFLSGGSQFPRRARRPAGKQG
jgi:hypothetical protein